MTILDALILSLPARNSTVRMRAWRALKDAGCAVLRDGVYVLPASASASTALGEVESDIRSKGGFAMKVELHLQSDEQRAHLRDLFDRSPEYGALVKKISEAKTSLPRLHSAVTKTKRQTLSKIFFIKKIFQLSVKATIFGQKTAILLRGSQRYF